MPLVIAHRGANRLAPENTLAAFRKALEFHVDGFENDVHMTSDGRLVVCHDDTVDRTSNGTGPICEKSFEELRQLDFGGWFAPAFAGEKIPALEEFFALCGPLKVVNVEIKRAPDGGTASAPAVVRMAKELGVFDKLIVSSFDMDMLQACLAEDANARVCFLYAPDNEAACEAVADDPAGFARKYGLYAYHPFVMLVSEEYIAACHAAGLAVNPWTVNQGHAMRLLCGWGADGIITDEPELAMQIAYGQS
jgi:glycerophosphoryl diester phosphodiesterase